MLKQALIYLILSILVVVFVKHIHFLVIYIDLIYSYCSLKLAPIFSGSAYGVMIRNIFTLMVIPLLIVAIPALIFRLIKGRQMPYLFEITWLIWLTLVLSKLMIR